MPTIDQQDAHDCICPFNDFKPCFGKACMAWVWVGASHERRSTNNLVDTPDGRRPDESKAPLPPPGDGWERDGDPCLIGYDHSAKLKLPKATEQRWTRQPPRPRGMCGRVQAAGDDYCIPF